MLKVNCGGCGKTLSAPVKYSGRRVPCPGCGSDVDIPEATTAPQPPSLPPSRQDAFESIIEDAVHGVPTQPMPPYEAPLRERMDSGPSWSNARKNELESPAIKYRALRIMASIYRVLGAMLAIASILVFVLAVSNDGPAFASLYVLFSSLAMFAVGEGIMVFIDIEANTRRTSDALALLVKNHDSQLHKVAQPSEELPLTSRSAGCAERE